MTSLRLRPSRSLLLAVLLIGTVQPSYSAPVVTQIVAQFAFEQEEIRQAIEAEKFLDLTKADVFPVIVAFGGLDIFGVTQAAYYIDPDPLVNIRIEVENFSDSDSFFAFQLRFPTDVTAGPTFNDSFANLEVVDANEDGVAILTQASTFIEIVDDTGGPLINGSANLGIAPNYNLFQAEKLVLFDNVGVGPNSNDHEGPGFNFMRFSSAGVISPGDKVIITAMGCYNIAEDGCPDRYEIPAVPSIVPVPAAAWLFTSAIGLLGWTSSRKVRRKP